MENLGVSHDAVSASVDASAPFWLDGETLDTLLPPSSTDDHWLIELVDEKSVQTSEFPTRSSDGSIAQTTSEAAEEDRETSHDGHRRKEPRRRQRDELVYLRGRVLELENELLQLKDAKMGGNTDRTTSPDAVSEVENAETVDPLRSVVKQDVQTSVDAFWKRMAQRQSDARQQSLAENMRLREMLEGQLKVARALERLLRKRSLMPDEETTTPRSNPMIKRIRLDPRHEADIYAALVELFDTRYLETDRRLKESGLAAKKTTFQDAQFTGHGNGMDWYLTFLDSRVLPFPYAIASDVAWRSMQSSRVELDHGVYEAIECTDDLIKAKFMMTLSVRNTEVRGTTWFAMRRYLEAERMVLVWAVWSVAEGGVLKNRAIQLIEDGWSIVEPLAGTEYSVAQVYGRLQPDPTALVDSAEEHIGLLTDMILVKYHQNLGGLYVRLETMLMEEACPAQ